MAQADLVDGLIATYRNLNLALRPLPAERANQAGADGKSLLSHVAALREGHELRSSQQLKLMTLVTEATEGTLEAFEIEPSSPEANLRELLSEFGTAREAILALIREMPEEEWTRERAGPNGSTTIQRFIEELATHDRQAVSQIDSLTGARAS